MDPTKHIAEFGGSELRSKFKESATRALSVSPEQITFGSRSSDEARGTA
jgi:hypothetical protein